MRSNLERQSLKGLERYLTIGVLIKQMDKNFKELVNSIPDTEQDKAVIEILKSYKESSTSGYREARRIIKEHIKTALIRGFNVYEVSGKGEMEDVVKYRNICIDEYNGLADVVIPFQETERLTILEKFEILLYLFRDCKGTIRDRGFKRLLEKYPCSTKQRVTKAYTAKNLEYSAQDIDEVFRAVTMERVQDGIKEYLSFSDKLAVIAQRVYEEVFGLKQIDLLAYSDINEVGFARDGSYVYCWCDHKYWLSFLSLSEDEARVVQERAISWDKSVGPINEANPERLCHRADGARITVTQKPYFSARNACIRIFNANELSYEEILDCERLRAATTALVRNNQIIMLQGGLGVGKTTLMQTMFEILDDHLHIGLIEDRFEQHIMEKFPYKRVVEGQAVKGRELKDVVATLFRMSVDVAALGEIRSGDALYAYLQLIQSVSMAAWTTIHINKPENTIPRCKNLLLGTGRYETEQAAVSDLIHNINFIYQHEIINGKRTISQIVEIVPAQAASLTTAPSIETPLEDLKKLYYINEIQRNPCYMYSLNPILRLVEGEPRFISYPSPKAISNAKKSVNGWSHMERLLEFIEYDIGIPHREGM